MKIAKLFLPGDYEDAFLYKGWLLAITVERSVDVIDLRLMIDDLARRLSEGSSFLPFLFLQNNWLHGAQFAAFMSNEVVFSTFCDFYDSLPDPIEVANPADYLRDRNEIPVETRAILDLNIYNDRLYLGLDKGCFQRDLNWSRRHVEPKGELERRSEARCMGISTGFGALNLSCGDDGLFTSADVFDWDRRINPQHELKQIARSSLRSSWMRQDLMNYSSPSQPELFRGDQTFAARKKLVQLRDETVPLDELLHQVKQDHGVSDEDIQFSFNSDDLMFVHTYSGRFFGIEVDWKKSDIPRPRVTKTYKGEQARILSADFCRAGTAIETEDRVFIFKNGIWQTLLEDAVISLRTFPAQTQFQNMVLAVTERGITLISVFDDTAVQRRRRHDS